MKTYVATPKDITHAWYVVDAADMVLGRLASEVASRLRGKHKPTFTPFMDTGDFIIVVNAEKVRLTGSKLTDKMYFTHSRFPGGLKGVNAQTRLTGLYPERVIQEAVVGMLPKNRLGRAMVKKLKVYAGADHPHAAQQPIALKLS